MITPEVFPGISEEDLSTQKGRARLQEGPFGMRPFMTRGGFYWLSFKGHYRPFFV